jgi:peptidyl-tRNA hydrolase
MLGTCSAARAQISPSNSLSLTCGPDPAETLNNLRSWSSAAAACPAPALLPADAANDANEATPWPQQQSDPSDDWTNRWLRMVDQTRTEQPARSCLQEVQLPPYVNVFVCG